MKITLIALGASAGCLFLAGSAMAGPCTARIDALTEQLAMSDAGMGPTGANAGAAADATAGVTTGSASTGVGASASGTPQVETTPATSAMNEASQNKATSSQDVQSQNTGDATAADQTGNAGAATSTNAEALASLQRAQQLDQAGDDTCMDELSKAENALKIQP
jgi:hypothetical protein